MNTTYLTNFLFECLTDLLGRFRDTQVPNVIKAASLIGASLMRGQICHFYGSGHSALVCRDVVSRAGSPVQFNQIVDATNGAAEKIDGYGKLLFDRYAEQYQTLPGEVIVIVSNSGYNIAPLEVAKAARNSGLIVVSVVCLQQVRRYQTENPSKILLPQLSDVVIDNCSIDGDSPLTSEDGPIAAMSGIAGCIALQSLVTAIVDSIYPNIFPRYSSRHLDNAEVFNDRIRQQFVGRLRRTGA
jgi:uncharacterized phosphosugar-binding protein